MSSGKLARDASNRPIQVFTPKKVVSITSATAWTPDEDDSVFCVPSDCTYTITLNGSTSDSANLTAGDVRGIVEGASYTFTIAGGMYIEVM